MGNEYDDEYRKAAQHCRHMANAARHADTKRQWLVLAESLLRMISPENRAASENFEAEQAPQRGGQEESKSSY
jgi:hypothetical protein